MERRELLKVLGLGSGGLLLGDQLNAFNLMMADPMTKASFGKDFHWGVAAAGAQTEGAVAEDGKSPSIWDVFCHKKGKIKTGENGDVSCDFYHRYPEDIALVKEMNMDVFRMSLAWSRILPEGTGKVNQKGIDHYNRVIDTCLKTGVQPWLTLYHWDLPQILEDKGGWTNRDVISWFNEYTEVSTRAFGDRVKNWMILNEPLAFTSLGYLLGIHAPGKRGFKKFLPAVHHASMCQAEAARIVKVNVREANVGTTFSCSSIEPFKNKPGHELTAHKWDALINRLFIEPSLGMGYPTDALPAFKRIEKHMKPGDAEKLKFDFDFIGIQNYTREIARYNCLIPIMRGKNVAAKKRNVPTTDMGWEVYPDGIYKVLKQFGAYPGIKKIYVTENGAAFPDVVENGRVHDTKRVQFFKDYLAAVLKAKNEGVNVKGYLVWTLTDNFEWAEGYRTRFGLVHVDFDTQKRTIKDSGLWFKEFLKS